MSRFELTLRTRGRAPHRCLTSLPSHCSSVRKTTPYQVRRSILESLTRSHISAEDTFEACEHLVGMDHTVGDQEALATLRHHQRSAALKSMSTRFQKTKRPSSPTSSSSKKQASESHEHDLTDGMLFEHDDVRDFYIAMRSSALFIAQQSSACEQNTPVHAAWDDVKKKGVKMTKEEKERDR
jgi:hypothetical protein